MRRPDPRAARNTATLVVLLGGCAVMAAVPFLSMKTTENLMNRDKALTGTQVQRGPFMNSGSKDVGRDPNWKDGRFIGGGGGGGGGNQRDQ